MEFRENYFSEVSLFGQHFHQVSKPPASPSLSLCHSYYISCGGEIQRTSLKNLGKYQESSFTTASYPFPPAYDIAVCSSESSELTSTPSFVSSVFTTASCPFFAAHASGVRPKKSFRLISTSSFASSSFTTASWPLSAAHDSG